MGPIKRCASILLTAMLCVWIIALVAEQSKMWWERSPHLEPRRIRDWRNLLSDRTPSLGKENAAVVIIEFSDYECPYCKVDEPLLQHLVSKHFGRVALYRFEFPQEGLHPLARAAAIAAACASAQGVNEAFQDLLFKRQAELSSIGWGELAREAGIRKEAAFATCIEKRATSSGIEQDIAVSKKLHIKGTPTFIINGRVIDGAVTMDELERLYSEAERSGE